MVAEGQQPDTYKKECLCTTPEYTIELNQQGPPGLQGEPGADGFSPKVTIEQQDRTNYILRILTIDGPIVTPNLQGRGVPNDGITGQILMSDGGIETEWVDMPFASEESPGIIAIARDSDIYNPGEEDPEGEEDNDDPDDVDPWTPSDDVAVSPKKMIEYVDAKSNRIASELIQVEANTREEEDNKLQQQIDALSVASDVSDVVGTYQELQSYDKSKLQQNNIIKVLTDSTHNDAMTYYRLVGEEFVYIGSEGPFYTKSEVNDILSNLTIDGGNIAND